MQKDSSAKEYPHKYSHAVMRLKTSVDWEVPRSRMNELRKLDLTAWPESWEARTKKGRFSEACCKQSLYLPIWFKNECLGESEIFRLNFISFSQYSGPIVSISITQKKRILHIFWNICSLLKSYPGEVRAESFAKRSQILVSVVVSSKEERVPTSYRCTCEIKRAWGGSKNELTCANFILVGPDDNRRKNTGMYLGPGYFWTGWYSAMKRLALLFQNAC